MMTLAHQSAGLSRQKRRVRTPVDRFWRSCLVTRDRKSTRLNSSHSQISYAVFCLKKKDVLPPSEPRVTLSPCVTPHPRASSPRPRRQPLVHLSVSPCPATAISVHFPAGHLSRLRP